MNFLISTLSQAFAYVLAYLPRFLKIFLAKCLSALWFDILRIRRFTALKNLHRVYPEKTLDEKLQIARTSLFYQCYGLFEFCEILRLTPQNFKDQVVFHNLEIYEKALSENKGVFLLSLHVGNGDIGLIFLGLLGFKINHISKKFKNKTLNDFWFGMRQKRGVKILDPHGAKLAFEIMGATRRNEAVTFVQDQFMGKPYGIETSFFGITTGTAYGLALFHLKTRTPVVPVYTYRDENFKTHVVFVPEVNVALKSTERDLQINELTEEYNRQLERIILKHPEQWMWIHKRWKTWE